MASSLIPSYGLKWRENTLTLVHGKWGDVIAHDNSFQNSLSLPLVSQTLWMFCLQVLHSFLNFILEYNFWDFREIKSKVVPFQNSVQIALFIIIIKQKHST